MLSFKTARAFVEVGRRRKIEDASSPPTFALMRRMDASAFARPLLPMIAYMTRGLLLKYIDSSFVVARFRTKHDDAITSLSLEVVVSAASVLSTKTPVRPLASVVDTRNDRIMRPAAKGRFD